MVGKKISYYFVLCIYLLETSIFKYLFVCISSSRHCLFISFVDFLNWAICLFIIRVKYSKSKEKKQCNMEAKVKPYLATQHSLIQQILNEQLLC